MFRKILLFVWSWLKKLLVTLLGLCVIVAGAVLWNRGMDAALAHPVARFAVLGPTFLVLILCAYWVGKTLINSRLNPFYKSHKRL